MANPSLYAVGSPARLPLGLLLGLLYAALQALPWAALQALLNSYDNDVNDTQADWR